MLKLELDKIGWKRIRNTLTIFHFLNMIKKLLVITIACFIISCKNDKKATPIEEVTTTTIDDDDLEENEKDEDNSVFHVSTLKELVEALGDDRTIVITNDIYIVEEFENFEILDENFEFSEPDFHPKYVGDYFEIASAFSYSKAEEDVIKDDYKDFRTHVYLVIRGTTNLTITSDKNTRAQLILKHVDTEVIELRNNENLHLIGLDIYHDPANNGGCGEYAPVINIDGGQEYTIQNCELNGSGTHGILAKQVDIITIEDSKIFNCSFYGIHLEDVTNFHMKNSTIVDNDFISAIYARNSNASFKNSTIARNLGDNQFLIDVDDFEVLSFENCTITENFSFTAQPEIEDFFKEKNDFDLSQFKAYAIPSDKMSVLFVDDIKNATKTHTIQKQELTTGLSDKTYFREINMIKDLEDISKFTFIAVDTSYVLHKNKIPQPSMILFDGIHPPVIHTDSKNYIVDLKNTWNADVYTDKELFLNLIHKKIQFSQRIDSIMRLSYDYPDSYVKAIREIPFEDFEVQDDVFNFAETSTCNDTIRATYYKDSTKTTWDIQKTMIYKDYKLQSKHRKIVANYNPGNTLETLTYNDQSGLIERIDFTDIDKNESIYTVHYKYLEDKIVFIKNHRDHDQEMNTFYLNDKKQVDRITLEDKRSPKDFIFLELLLSYDAFNRISQKYSMISSSKDSIQYTYPNDITKKWTQIEEYSKEGRLNTVTKRVINETKETITTILNGRYFGHTETETTNNCEFSKKSYNNRNNLREYIISEKH